MSSKNIRILSIETSCDETAVSIIEFDNGNYKILSNYLFSQADIHKEFGGVFPTIAKREHKKNLPILSELAIKKANLYKDEKVDIDKKIETIKKIFIKDEDLFNNFLSIFKDTKKLNLDYIAVTVGPGLSPALFIGVNFARALSCLFEVPVIPVNHMEGHIVASMVKDNSFIPIKFPLISLLVSGGHTELVLSNKNLEYTKIGQTLDDAAGEAFDKTARLLGIPYPGGPQISKLAEEARKNNLKLEESLPRPILKSNNYNFSYSGLKTATRVLIEKQETINDELKGKIAREIEEAIVETLIYKTKKAVEEYRSKTLIIGGGVSSNIYLRTEFIKEFSKYDKLNILFPEIKLSTDNSIMIGLAGFLNRKSAISQEKIQVNANFTF